LCKLFQIFLLHSYFSKVWKESFIFPLHKKGSKSDIKNYRGIAKQSAINKCIDQLITAQLQHQCSSAMSPIRHGFTKRRSTSTNLLEFTSVIRSAFKYNFQTEFRFRKPSAIIEKKIILFGFTITLTEWISTNLSNRTFKSSISNLVHVTSGVPQESHRGPLLLGIFINDVPQVVLMMYANDIKRCLPLTNPYSHAIFQADLNNMHCWCIQNLLFSNISKYNFMSFYRKNPFSHKIFYWVE